MQDLFVTKDIAIKLKALGFDSECFGGYDIEYDKSHKHFNVGKIWYPSASTRSTTTTPRVYKKTCHQNKHITKAPTWSEAIEFLEQLGYIVSISPELYIDGINWLWQILWYLPIEEQSTHDIYDGTYSYGDNGEYPTRKLAEKAAIEKIFLIIEEREVNKNK